MTQSAISYSRFSSVGQIGGTSIERQLKLAKAYCLKHDLILDDTLTDRATSAFHGDHANKGALSVFLKAVETDLIPRGTYLIVEHLDRLSRENVWDAMAQFTSIIQAGIKIVTLFDEHVYEVASKAVEMDLIMAILHMSEAHKSSLTKSIRANETLTIKRSNPDAILTKTRPAWLDIIDGKFVPNEGAKAVKRIFREAASGLGSYVIATGLNRDKIPTLTGNKTHGKTLPDGTPHPKAGQSKSNLWTLQRVVEIIRSDSALGWLQLHRGRGANRVPDGEPRKNYYPAVIDQAMADKARAALSSRAFGGAGAGRKGGVVSNLFSHVAICDVCGSSMNLTNKLESRRRQTGWLRCIGAIKDRSFCTNRTGIPYLKLEQAFIRDFGIIQKIVRASPDADSKTAELAELLAQKTAEADRLKTTISNMAAAFGDMTQAASFAILADQMRVMAERHLVLTTDIAILEKQLLTEKQANRNIDQQVISYTVERMESPDPDVSRKARSEMAMAIRGLLKGEPIICRTDRLVKLQKGRFTTQAGHPIDLMMAYDEDFEMAVQIIQTENGQKYNITAETAFVPITELEWLIGELEE